MVHFDDRYLTTSELHQLVQQADIVLLPYDSREQVTSGVLIEAVTAGKPVISTGFPHAVELLSGGAGLIVERQDPDQHRRRDPPGAHRAGPGGQHAGRGEPDRSGPAVAGGRRPLPPGGLRRHPGRRRAGQRVSRPAADESLARPPVSFAHLFRLSDRGGLFEHARFTEPRPEHGYCIDDIARGLVVLAREPQPSEQI